MLLSSTNPAFTFVLSSKLERAKKFKRWVTAEVLPSIRKHGAYMTDALLAGWMSTPELISEYIGKLRAENAKANAAREALKRRRPRTRGWLRRPATTIPLWALRA